MAKTFQPYEPEQSLLFPPSPRDWLPEGHLAYFVMDVVRELDLADIKGHYEKELRGYPPYHPQMMTALLLYGYCSGVASSRKIERKTYEDVAFRVIAAGHHPDHTAISEFRRIHLEALAGLFVQVLQLCRKAGLVKLGHVALDGRKVKALLEAAKNEDAYEDQKYGVSRRGDELPEELQRAKSRLAKIRAAKRALEEEAAQGPDDGEGGSGTSLPNHRVPATKEGKPTPKAQRNFTDAESRIQKSGDGFVQGYNAQVAVDEEAQIIVAQALTNQPPDVEHLVPMLERVRENCGAMPLTTTADAGYFSEANVLAAQAMGTDPHIATGRRKHDEPAPKVRGRMPSSLTIKERMARKLRTLKGRATYAKRKWVVEPVFGQIKATRSLRQLLLRGLHKARGEWAMISLTHNLLKLHAARA